MYAMGLFFMTCSVTSCTWIFDFFSATMTDITGYLATHHTKRGLRIDVIDTSAMTASTSDWTCSWLSTRTVTCTTACFTIVLNFFSSKIASSKVKFTRYWRSSLDEERLIARKHRLPEETLRRYPQNHRSHLPRQTAKTASTTKATVSTSSTILVIGRTFWSSPKSHRLLELPCIFPQHQAPC